MTIIELKDGRVIDTGTPIIELEFDEGLKCLIHEETLMSDIK